MNQQMGRFGADQILQGYKLLLMFETKRNKHF